MHMKKAVTIVKSLLKFPKLRRKNDSQKTDSEGERQEKPKLPEVTIFRPCERCVLIYENSVWKSIQRRRKQQEYDDSEWCDNDEDPAFKTTHKNPVNNRIQGFFQHHGLVRKNQEIPVCIDKSCMNPACLRAHAIWECKSPELNMPAHFPAFAFLVQSKENWSTPVLYEDSEIILFRMTFSMLRSTLNWNSTFDSILAMNIEAWVVITKLFQRTEVTLEAEKALLDDYLDYDVLMLFLDVPSSREARIEHLDSLFQAVDNIMDISLYITLASGIPPENQSYIKDTIIETATVVTSTAAESTATVGIETAAMAMGQAAAGVALSVLVDIAITAGMVTRAKIRRDKGLISQKEFQKTVRHKLCDSGCQFIGGTTGTIVGQVLIPVPVVGAIVGGFCGSLIGAGVSKGIIKTSEIISKTQASKMKAITDK